MSVERAFVIVILVLLVLILLRYPGITPLS